MIQYDNYENYNMLTDSYDDIQHDSMWHCLRIFEHI